MTQGTGVKHDGEKPPLALISTHAMNELGKVLAFGAKKYTEHNWRGGMKWTRLLSACLRHVMSYVGGEDKDPETGLSHLAHAMACLMMLLEYEHTHKELDDRYKVSTAPKKGRTLAEIAAGPSYMDIHDEESASSRAANRRAP